MADILSGLDGVVSMVDDILVYAPDINTHNERLFKVLQRLQENNVTLKYDKCEFGVTSLKFLGFQISSKGVEADPDKIRAISHFPAPKNVTEVRRFLGLFNQVAKFVKNVSHETAPIRALLQKDKEFYWGPDQEKCFKNLKSFLTSNTVLAHYSPMNETRIESDAATEGVGSLLLQKIGEDWRPVCYASRSLSDVEKRYAVIEKELLGITFACSRFRDYLVGLSHFEIITDHSPLVSLLNVKNIDELSPRLQRMRLKIAGLPYVVKYCKGSLNVSADCLSRAPVDDSSENFDSELKAAEISFIQSMAVSDNKLSLIISEQKKDPILSRVRNFCLEGWPRKIPISVQQFSAVSSELCIINDVLCKSNRIVIPGSLRIDTLNRIHEGHLGIIKCLEKARSCVWWPGITRHIKDRISTCDVCCRMITNKAEPLIAAEFPSRPWQKVSTDLFYCEGKTYLVVIDSYSRWIECPLLLSTTSNGVITHLKSIFARLGVPEQIFSDGGPQFSSYEFDEFAKNYGFEHVTSSPHFPQSNGLAEKGVNIVKTLFKKCKISGEDPYISLMNYRSSPIRNGYSPSELLMARKMRTRVPIMPIALEPENIDTENLIYREKLNRKKYKTYHDIRYGAKNLPKLKENDKVLLKSGGEGVVISDHNTPRSYIVQKDDGGRVRRNRRHLVKILHSTPSSAVSTDSTDGTIQCYRKRAAESPLVRRSKRTNIGVPPERYGF